MEWCEVSQKSRSEVAVSCYKITGFHVDFHWGIKISWIFLPVKRGIITITSGWNARTFKVGSLGNSLSSHLGEERIRAIK